MSNGRFGVLIALLACVAGPAFAGDGDIDKCLHGHGDEAILNCTDLIRGFGHLSFSNVGPKAMWRFVAPFYLARGTRYVEQGQDELALADFDVSTQRDPSNAVAWHAACLARMRLNKELDVAESDCSAAVELDPQWVGAIGDRGVAELRLGKLALAASDFDTVIANDPNSKLGLFCRGVIKLRQGDETGGKGDIAAAERN